jgi:hypothetical protein
MPRQLRIEYAGAIYHVLSRGDRKQAICRDDVDRQDFLKTPAEACQKTGFQVHAYCLMNNHLYEWRKTNEVTRKLGKSMVTPFTINLRTQSDFKFAHILRMSNE